LTGAELYAYDYHGRSGRYFVDFSSDPRNTGVVSLLQTTDFFSMNVPEKPGSVAVLDAPDNEVAASRCNTILAIYPRGDIDETAPQSQAFRKLVTGIEATLDALPWEREGSEPVSMSDVRKRLVP
jgi:hypothetical protein